MRSFVLPDAELIPGRQVELPTELVRHLRTVLRLSPGAQIQLLNGRGGVAQARLLGLTAGCGSAEVLAAEQLAAAAVSLSLIQGLPKGEKLELVLQKGTELGAGQFVLTRMARSVGRFKAERKQSKLERWEKIVLEAARQSGQPFLPRVQLADSFGQAINEVTADLKLMLWEEAAMPLCALLPPDPPQRIAVIIGPEGGMNPAEAKQAQVAGYRAVRLGPRILRTETAGLAVLAILQYLYGDLNLGQSVSGAPFQGKDES